MKKLISIFLAAAAAFSVLSLSSCKEETGIGKYVADFTFDGKTVSGSLSYTFTGISEDIKFNLYANAYREGAKYFVAAETDMPKAYPDGVNYGGIDVSNVTLNGKNADYQLIGEDLNVLDVSLKDCSSSENTVKIDFSTKVPICSNRLGISGDRVRLTDFFPISCAKADGDYYECLYSPYGDPYFSENCDYEIKLTVPSEFVVAASAYPVQAENGGEFTTYSYGVKSFRDFAFALGKDYAVTAGKAANAEIYYYADKEREDEVGLIKRAIDYFSETFGKYAYSTYSVAETPLTAAGMEYSGMCYIASDLTDEERRTALVHEIAHEWWHSAVGFNEAEEAFLDEGLAQYSAYLFFKNNGFKNEAENMLNNAKAAYKAFFDIKTLLSDGADTSMKRALKDFKSEYEYVNIAYNKSLIMFFEYASAVGENRAVKGLKTFYKNNLGKNASSKDLIETLGLEEFFESYISGRVII